MSGSGREAMLATALALMCALVLVVANERNAGRATSAPESTAVGGGVTDERPPAYDEEWSLARRMPVDLLQAVGARPAPSPPPPFVSCAPAGSREFSYEVAPGSFAVWLEREFAGWEDVFPSDVGSQDDVDQQLLDDFKHSGKSLRDWAGAWWDVDALNALRSPHVEEHVGAYMDLCRRAGEKWEEVVASLDGNPERTEELRREHARLVVEKCAQMRRALLSVPMVGHKLAFAYELMSRRGEDGAKATVELR